MRKICLLLLPLLLLLSSCGGKDAEKQAMLDKIRTAPYLQIDADVKCEYEEELREYELICHDEPGGLSVVSVAEPQELLGLAAEFEGESKRLRYQDTVLDAPLLGENALSPAEVLPKLCDAIREGYINEENREKYGDRDAWRLNFAVEEGEKSAYYTVWFAEDDGTVLAAEVSDGEKINFRIAFRSFLMGDDTEE